MSDTYLSFTRKEHWIACDLYDALLKNGVAPEAMDTGYAVANYNGLQCGDPKQRSCIRGFGDGRLDAEEVIEFALNDYKRYQKLIEGVLGRPLPWVFDDLDPKTDDDAKVREKADAVIALARDATKGDRAAMLMMLYAFTAFPKESLTSTIDSIIEEKKNDSTFDPEKARGVRKLITDKGTLKIRYDDNGREDTALKALEIGAGQCTEQANILFALLERAGYAPYYVFVDLAREEVPLIEPYLDERRLKEKHVCLGVDIGGQTYLLDPMFPPLINERVPYKHYMPLGLRQYLSMEYVNYHDPKSLDDSLLLDPMNPVAHLNRSINMYGDSRLTEAIGDLAEFMRLMPDSKGRIDLDASAEKRWSSSEERKAVANAIKNDTEMDVGLIEFVFMVACAAWKNNNTKEASQALFVLMNKLRFVHQIIPKVKIAPSTDKFFNDWFSIMPKEMKVHPAFSFSIDTIISRLKGK